MYRLHWLWIVALVAVVACGDDDPADPNQNDRDAERNAVATALEDAFTLEDFESYAALLHEDFEFQFADDDFDLAGTLDGRWDRARDLDTVGAMLGGEPIKDGTVVQSIDFQLTPIDPSWSTDVDPEFAGSRKRRYSLSLDLELSGSLLYQARSDQELYIVQVDDVWVFRFWKELGPASKSGVDGITLGDILSLWSSPALLSQPDDVILNLVQAYLQRDIDQYIRLQHPDFQFQFPADEFDLSGTPSGRWDASRDRQSTNAMFSGMPDKDGHVLQNIELALTPKDLIWSDDVEPEFEGSLRRTYTTQMNIGVSGNLTYQIRGEQEFYVQRVEVNGDLLWKLRFWRDLGVNLFKRATEERSVGAMKANW